ncbi:Protein of unknown function [Azotobacter beijerinckii]|uniref:Phage DNA packaging protein, Nu1 subunit of terminase n=1 Tax=Azotobacter beijerinckii TaxID=170623 RepID=A0A1H6UR67_9GAMM|nr:DUF1441 family protein [Azotobacter beijerinckii]SEI90555.1 Protein of unknown function [Azotobacter beijerinckii]
MSVTLVHSGARLWSINALAEEFGIDRRTVKRRLEGIPPVGETKGHPAWRLRDVVVAVMGPQVAAPEDDPDKLPPAERLTHYRAEREKAKWLAEQRFQIPVDEVEEVVATAFKSLASALDTLPDVLERDCALRPEEVERVISVVDGAREALYQQLLDVCSLLDETVYEDS